MRTYIILFYVDFSRQPGELRHNSNNDNTTNNTSITNDSGII